MYQGSHVSNSGRKKPRMKRSFILLAALILIVGVAVGTTVAYLVDDTDAVTNSFEYAKVSCTVLEDVSANSKSNVQIQNTGTTDAYIRATYVVNWEDAEGNIVASVPDGYSYTITENPNSTWTKGTDGYFYYLTPVAPNGTTTGSLLNCSVTLPANPEYKLSVEILATAVQSNPASAVTEAWGVTPNAA